MKITRLYTTTDRPIEDQIEWKTVDVAITGKVAQVPRVEVPARWSQNAANILADKYLRKAGVPSETIDSVKDIDHSLPFWLRPREPHSGTNRTITYGPETSARQIFNRMAGAWTYWGWREGYFKVLGADADKIGEEDARAFYDELYYMLAMQIAVPNSPQWFNTGLHWAYGIAGPDSGMWRVGKEHKVTDDGWPIADRVYNSYENPQPHACFLTPTRDDLVNEGGIMDTWVREARIFKHGSGSGVNPSTWRALHEPLSGGGRASGVMSWLAIGDRAAGAIQSGGTTRRAAKMVCLDDDHPELLEFIRWKVREEGKAAAMDVGSQVLRLKYGGFAPIGIDIPQPMIDRLENGFEPEALPATWESEAMRTIDGQNSNNSVRVTDAFMRSAEGHKPWNLIARTTGEVAKIVNAGEVWNEICRAAWASADPGLLFHDTINSWHTTAADGPIRTTNPCAEFHSNDGSACNLASLRLTAFLNDDGSIDLDRYEHACRLWTMVLDISVSMASFPAREFAEGAYNYRTLGLGYADLGGLLMRLALPYDSDEGRALAAALTALMTGVAYRTSAELAEELGPFPRWEANVASFYGVMHKHREAVDFVSCEGQAGRIVDRSIYVWEHVLEAKSFRNAQTTLIAPTGTISFVMDCDTTGCEPDYALVKDKQLAGGGTMVIVNQAVPMALGRLGFDERDTRDAINWISEAGTLDGWPGIYRAPTLTLRVFHCVADLRPMAHVLMVAALQPHLSGAASKTVNLPNDATVEDVSGVYREAWRLGVKAIALYRDGSKLTQPLAAAKPKIAQTSGETDFLTDPKRRYSVVADTVFSRNEREALTPRARGYRQKFKLDGHSVYLHTGEYPDGRLAEIFTEMSKEGSTVRSLVNGFAKAISIGLQYGVPLDEFVDAFVHTKFEPAGIVEGHERIRLAQSLFDLIFRDVAIHYLGREELANVPAVEAAVGVEEIHRKISEFVESRPPVALAAWVNVARKAELDECPDCHNLSLVRTGTCRTCTRCSYNEGCG